MSAFLTPAAEHTFATALVVGILAWAALWTLRQGWRWLMVRAARNVAAMVDHALGQITIDDLADDLNGYPRAGLERLLDALDESAETFEWLPVETPEHRTPIAEAVDFAMWQREVEAG